MKNIMVIRTEKFTNYTKIDYPYFVNEIKKY